MGGACFCVGIAALMFSIFEPISKLVAGDIAPAVITFIRFLIGGVCLMPLSIVTLKKRNKHLGVKDHLFMALLGVLLICMSMLTLQTAVKFGTSPAMIAIIFSCNPIFTIALSAVAFKERITLRSVLAIVLCMTGILICSWQEISTDVGAFSTLLTLVAAVSFSIYTVLSRIAVSTHQLDGRVSLAFSFLYGGAVLAIYLLCSGVGLTEGVCMENISILLVLGIGVTGIGYLAYLKAIERASAAYASLAFFCKPIIAPFAAFLINGTPFSKWVFLGLVFVVSGLYCINRSGKTKPDAM